MTDLCRVKWICNLPGWLLIALISICSPVAAMDAKPHPYLVLLANDRFSELQELENSLQESLTYDDFGTPELSTFFEILAGKDLNDDQDWLRRRVLLNRWVEQSGSSDTANIVLATHFKNYAWFLRGSSFASKTIPDRMALYRDNIAMARSILARITTSAYKHAGYWELWLDLGLSSQWSRLQFETFYKAATAIQPSYFEYHAAKARFYLPRWHGDAETFQAVVSELETQLKPYYGGKTYGWLQARLRYSKMFEDGQTDWERLEKSYREILEHHPSRRNRITFAQFACRANEYGDLAELLPIDPEPTIEEWGEHNYTNCLQLAQRFDSGKTVGEFKNQESSIPDSSLVQSQPASAARTEMKFRVPSDPTDAEKYDRQRLALLAGDNTVYEDLREAVFEISKRQPNTLIILDELGLELLRPEYQQVLVSVGKQDLERVKPYIHRVKGRRYAIARELKGYYRSVLGPKYTDWLVEHPVLWEKQDLPYLPVSPEDLLAGIESINQYNLDPLSLQMEAVTLLITKEPALVAGYIARQGGNPEHQLWSSVNKYLADTQGNEEALRIINRYDDSRFSRTRSILIRLAHQGIDPIAMLDRLGLVLPEPELASGVITWAYNNPKSASQYLSRLETRRQRTINTVTDYYKKKFDDEFYTWLELNPEWVRAKDIEELAQIDREKAELLISLQEDAVFRQQLTESLDKQAPTGTVAEVLPQLELPSSKLQREQIAALSKVAQRDPNEAMFWVLDNQQDVPLVSVGVIAQAASSRGLLHVFEWLENFPEDPSLREARVRAFKTVQWKRKDLAAQLILAGRVAEPEPLVKELASEWVKDAPAEAVAFVTELTEFRDSGWIGLGDGMAKQGKYSDAADYYLRIEEARLRTSQIRRLLPRLDGESFEQAADAVQLSELERESYRR